MKSKELADFAGVSIRTLRHYHNLGLLEEPPRNQNGYREYRATDAAKLLRIKNLTSLGFTLLQVKEILDGEKNGIQRAAADALDTLDEELAKEAARIQEKRALIRQLKESGNDPDAPLAYSSHMSRLRKNGASKKLMELEREGLFIMEQDGSLSPEEAQGASQLLDIIGQDQSIADYISLCEEFYALTEESTPSQQNKVVADFACWFAKILSKGKALHGWNAGLEDNVLGPEPSIVTDFDREGPT